MVTTEQSFKNKREPRCYFGEALFHFVNRDYHTDHTVLNGVAVTKKPPLTGAGWLTLETLE